MTDRLTGCWWRFRCVASEDRFAYGTDADASYYARRINANRYMALSDGEAARIGLDATRTVTIADERAALDDNF